jgi:hypothetical protein
VSLDDDTIRAAIRGYEEKIRLIDVQVAQISRRMAGKSVLPVHETPIQKRHKISAAGRARIAAAQRRRWAEKKKLEAQ